MGHTRPVRQVLHNYDGDLLFTCSDDSKVCMYDTYQCNRAGTFNCGSACYSIDVTKDSKYCLATASVDGVKIFDTSSGDEVAQVEVPGNLSYCIKLAFGDKQFFVLYKYEKYCWFRIFDLSNALNCGAKKEGKANAPNVIQEIKSTSDNIYTHALWGPLNKSIYASTNSGKVLNIDVTSGKTLKELQVHKTEIYQMQLTHDYTMLFTCSKDGTCKLLHPETFDEIRIFKFGPVPCRAVAVSPLFDDQDIQKFHCVIGGGIDAREAAFSDAKQGGGGFELQLHSIIFSEKLAEIHGSFGPVHAIDFSPDGQCVASGGEDGYVRY